MKNKARVSVMVIALALLGCKGVQPSAVANGASDMSGATAEEAAGGTASSGSGTQVEPIHDPSLDMDAIEVTIPAGWKFQSVFMQGGTCVPTPFGVFRSASPDGWSMVERMPTLAWQWGRGPMIANAGKTDCLPMRGPLSAQDFLKYMAGTMSVHYDGPAPVPADEEEKQQQQIRDSQARYAPQYAASHLQQPRTNRELARAQVSYTIGSTPMKGILDVTVDCTEQTFAGQQGLSNWSPGHPAQIVQGPASIMDKCLASTSYYTAPENKLAAVMGRWQAPGMGTRPVDAWINAWINRNRQQTNAMINQWNQAAAAKRQATAQQFAHSMAVQKQMHEQFMDSMQASTDASMARTGAAMYARSTAASDFVDLALDRQTVLNTSTGQVDKITNQVNVEDPLVKVHGNGAPW